MSGLSETEEKKLVKLPIYVPTRIKGTPGLCCLISGSHLSSTLLRLTGSLLFGLVLVKIPELMKIRT